jgi:hypothetical protein
LFRGEPFVFLQEKGGLGDISGGSFPESLDEKFFCGIIIMVFLWMSAKNILQESEKRCLAEGGFVYGTKGIAEDEGICGKGSGVQTVDCIGGSAFCSKSVVLFDAMAVE